MTPPRPLLSVVQSWSGDSSAVPNTFPPKGLQQTLFATSSFVWRLPGELFYLMWNSGSKRKWAGKAAERLTAAGALAAETTDTGTQQPA